MTTQKRRGPVFGVAVKQGKAQAQRITYDAKGAATIVALSGWVSLAEAQAVANAAKQ